MSNSAEELAISSFVLEFVLAAVAIAGAAFSSRPLGERLGLGRGRLSAVSIGALALGTLGLSMALDGLLELSGWREQSAIAHFEAQVAGARGRALLLLCLGIGIAPGVAEELLCRGLVQRGLVSRLGAPAAIGVAAVVFGLLHAEPLYAALAAVLGVYLGIAAHLAGSVRAPMFCHALNNLVAVFAAAYGFGPSVPAALEVPLGTVVAAGGLWAAIRAARLPPPAAALAADSGAESGAESDPADGPPSLPPSL